MVLMLYVWFLLCKLDMIRTWCNEDFFIWICCVFPWIGNGRFYPCRVTSLAVTRKMFPFDDVIMIAPASLKQLQNLGTISTRITKITTAKQSTTKPCAYSMWYTLCYHVMKGPRFSAQCLPCIITRICANGKWFVPVTNLATIDIMSHILNGKLNQCFHPIPWLVIDSR